MCGALHEPAGPGQEAVKRRHKRAAFPGAAIHCVGSAPAPQGAGAAMQETGRGLNRALSGARRSFFGKALMRGSNCLLLGGSPGRRARLPHGTAGVTGNICH